MGVVGSCRFQYRRFIFVTGEIISTVLMRNTCCASERPT